MILNVSESLESTRVCRLSRIPSCRSHDNLHFRNVLLNKTLVAYKKSSLSAKVKLLKVKILYLTLYDDNDDDNNNNNNNNNNNVLQ
jgi:hypothetical protein